MKDVNILMLDGCTKSEAVKHIERGTVVYEISDFLKYFDEYTVGMSEKSICDLKEYINGDLNFLDCWSKVESDDCLYIIEYVL